MKVYILTEESKFKAIDLGRLDNPKLYDKIYYLQNMETKKAASQKKIQQIKNENKNIIIIEANIEDLILVI